MIMNLREEENKNLVHKLTIANEQQQIHQL